MRTDAFDLSGRIAIVTGGSRGLGRAMVKHYEALVAERGDDTQVFYDTSSETARSKENP